MARLTPPVNTAASRSSCLAESSQADAGAAAAPAVMCCPLDGPLQRQRAQKARLIHRATVCWLAPGRQEASGPLRRWPRLRVGQLNPVNSARSAPVSRSLLTCQARLLATPARLPLDRPSLDVYTWFSGHYNARFCRCDTRSHLARELADWRAGYVGRVVPGACSRPGPALSCAAGNGGVRSTGESPRICRPIRWVTGEGQTGRVNRVNPH